MKRIVWPVAAAALVAAAAPIAVAAAIQPHGHRPPDNHSVPLRIMLTNDDGATASGLLAVRDALCAVGDNVTVVAPATNQSGTSAKFTTSGTVTATQTSFQCGAHTASSWAVSGTPADTVYFAKSVVFSASPPDLVISGSNAGNNVGDGVPHSGTVGAATTATTIGWSALAVSSGVSANAAATQAGYVATGRFVATLTARLAASQNHVGSKRPGGLLPANTLLNVNYPLPIDSSGAFDEDAVRAPVWTHVARRVKPLTTFAATPGSAGTYTVGIQSCDPNAVLGAATACPVERGGDQTALAEHRISITALAAPADHAPDTRTLRTRLRGLVP